MRGRAQPGPRESLSDDAVLPDMFGDFGGKEKKKQPRGVRMIR
jgi:hypothetical protein